MSRWGRLVMLVLPIAGGLGARIAHAQARPDVEAMAEKLFTDGRALMAAGRYAEACPKLAESQRIDPGVGTQLNLAECYEKNGQVASAWATYRDAETAAHRLGQKERERFAGQRTEELARALSFLTIEVPPSSRVAGLTVWRDGAPVGAPAWGTAVPVDAGTHAVEARAVGYVTWRADVRVGPADPLPRVVVPALQAVPRAIPPKPPETAVQRTLGVALGLTGVASLVAGTAFGGVAYAKNRTARDEHCSPMDCDSRGATLIAEAKDAALVSSVLFAVGGALGAAGLTLVFTAPRARSGAGVAVGGTW